MDLLREFQQYLKNRFPQVIAGQTKLLLAVSGGIDSIVLTDLIFKLGIDFVIAHCNFQLRGEESNRDEALVSSLGNLYQKQVLVQRFDTNGYALKHKRSIQEAARELRYNWFTSLLKTADCSFIVTAHHLDDNIETLLMHFFRGTGIQGLTGIPEISKERAVIRPLLFAKREAIEAYANMQELNWVQDSSNASEKYTRNFFRLRLIPSIEEVYPQVKQNLAENIHRFKEVALVYQQAIEAYKKSLLEFKGHEVHIPVLKLKKMDAVRTVMLEIVKEYGFVATQLDEVMKLVDASNGSFIQSSSHRIIRNRNWLIISPRQQEEAAHIIIEAKDNKIVFENGMLEIKIHNQQANQVSTSSLIASLDATTIHFPLLLRKYKQGDYFYPLGMQKKKKLSRFFIDQKLSLTDKEKVWVLETDKKIIWVIGYRIDDRFKVKESTKEVLRISLNITQ